MDEILANTHVLSELRRAWDDSNPGLTGGHEEGGFIVRGPDGNISVVRWPVGELNQIDVPPHPDCRAGGGEIIATFHTHPNTGDDYLQEPGESDRRGVRDDPDLKGESYVGEFVISAERIYLIAPDGRVSVVGETRAIVGS